VAAVARALGQIWSTLSADEKQVYQLKAAQERERVQHQMEAWKAAGGVAELPESKYDSSNSLVFPVARIRKICKLDADVRGLSKEALLLITKAAELALTKLGAESVRVASIQNRRKLLPDDVAQVCSSREQFLFLREDIQDLTRNQTKDSGKKKTEEKPKSNNPMTNFFATKSKD